MMSANAFNLDKSKILPFGKEVCKKFELNIEQKHYDPEHIKFWEPKNILQSKFLVIMPILLASK